MKINKISISLFIGIIILGTRMGYSQKLKEHIVPSLKSKLGNRVLSPPTGGKPIGTDIYVQPPPTNEKICRPAHEKHSPTIIDPNKILRMNLDPTFRVINNYPTINWKPFGTYLPIQDYTTNLLSSDIGSNIIKESKPECEVDTHELDSDKNLDFHYWVGNFNIFLGQKMLRQDEWGPVEKQVEFGAQFDLMKNSWPVSITMEYLTSKDDGVIFDPQIGDIDVTGKTSEFNLGLKKIRLLSKYIDGFIGGGLSSVRAECIGKAWGIKVSTSDENLGYWVSGGISLTTPHSINIGFELKYSNAKVELFDEADDPEAEAGGIHIGLLVGYHWSTI
ncbi:MAG: hypothetical protein ACMUJM_04185 [bacterium]